MLAAGENGRKPVAFSKTTYMQGKRGASPVGITPS